MKTNIELLSKEIGTEELTSLHVSNTEMFMPPRDCAEAFAAKSIKSETTLKNSHRKGFFLKVSIIYYNI